MTSNILRIAFRQLYKKKLFSLVNIIGLSTGLASMMALMILVYQYVRADSNQKDIDQLYYLRTNAPGGESYQTTAYPLLGEIVKKCPEVYAATHIQNWSEPWLKYQNRELQEQTEYVDTAFLRVFQFPLKYGRTDLAFRDKYSIVLSEEAALRLFGKENPVGKIILADDTLALTVTAVLRHVPSNSTIRPNVLIPTTVLIDNVDFSGNANWYNGFAHNYLRLRPGSSPQALDIKIQALVKINYADERKGDRVVSAPFSQIGRENAPLNRIIIAGAASASALILLVILLNLINLNTAGMFSRVKEMAIRKMIGASKRSIIWQFCVENGLLVMFSFMLAWLLFRFALLPNISAIGKDQFGEIETGFRRDYPLVLLFLTIGLSIAILGASVPALKLISVKVIDAVKGKLVSGNYKVSAVRNVIITIQFAVAVVVVAITLILNRQVNYMKTAALGFSQDNIGVVPLGLAFRDVKSATIRIVSILAGLKKNPHIKSVSLASTIPTAYADNFNLFYDPSKNKDVRMRQAGADAGFAPTFQIPIIAGRNFNDALVAADKKAVLINRSAMKTLGWSDIAGKQLRGRGNSDTYSVVGVLEDFHYQDLQSPIEPLIEYYSGKPSIYQGNLSIRVDAGSMTTIMNQLEKQFKAIPSRRSFRYQLMTDKVGSQYALLNGLLKITNYVSFLTILIAGMGMFGLISLFAGQRIKEIGIRKVLGASTARIAFLLSKDFLILVIVAIGIGMPVAWFIMHRWLLDFAYRIEIGWWVLTLSALIILLIALVTVGGQAVRAAIANPIKSLKTE